MRRISVLGLGLMGSALALTLQRAGHGLTVWNRTAQKTEPLVNAGASRASDVASAVQASPVILVCVDSYDVTRRFLEIDGVTPLLRGKTIVQLSTGTPLEAHQSAARFAALGAAYIDGAILGGPGGIGTDDAQILFAGPKGSFEQVSPLMDCLAGNIRYLGENIRAAAALDLAWLCKSYGLFLGLAHGAQLCESEGVSAELYSTMFPEDERTRDFLQVIGSDDFDKPTATLRIWESALRPVQQQARDAGINSQIPDIASRFLKKAIAEGYGEQDVAAMVKVMRKHLKV